MTKKLNYRLWGLFLMIALLSRAGICDEPAEETQIRKAIETYFFQGKLKADTSLLLQIIHEDWRLHNVQNGKLVRYVRSDFFSWLSDEDNSQAKFAIESIDVTGNVAAAKTSEDTGDFIWIDYFNLVKVDGKWWIIDKVACPVQKKSL